MAKGLLFRALAAIFVMSLAVLPMAGVNGRDFAGTYSTSNVSQSGNNYTLTFSAKVFNYSGADVTGATISLLDSVLPGQTYATYAGISIASKDKTSVSSSVTIPSREYQSWQQGAPPRLVIQFTDANGNNRLEAVELVREVAQ